MSNLSELLPAGGAAKEFEAVASGTLANGQTVVLNSDGTVSAVAGVTEGIGSSQVFESANSDNISATFDSNSNKVVIAYRDRGNSNYGTAVVGTVSGTSISFGSPVVFESASSDKIAATFDTNATKVVVIYRYNASNGRARVGTVSGTSISFGGAAIYEFGNTTYASVTFDSNSNKVVTACTDQSNSSYGTAAVGTVSGTSISFGTAVVFESASTSYPSATFDSNSNKVVIAYTDGGNSNYGTAIVGTVSGTSISFGSAAVFDSVSNGFNSSTFDSSANKVVIAYRDGTSPYYGKAVVGTVSGTSISFGSPVTFTTGDNYYHSATFDSNSNKVVIAYNDYANSDDKVIVGTVSGTSISFGTPLTFATGFGVMSTTYDSNANKVVIAYQDAGNSSYGTSVVFTVGSTNSADFIGITQEAIADTATGLVTPQGGVNTSVSSLTTGSDYYVQDDGTLSTTVSSVPAGRALSTTSILLEG